MKRIFPKWATGRKARVWTFTNSGPLGFAPHKAPWPRGKSWRTWLSGKQGWFWQSPLPRVLSALSSNSKSMHLPECARLCHEDPVGTGAKRGNQSHQRGARQLLLTRPGTCPWERHIPTLITPTDQGELDTAIRLSCNSNLLREGGLLVASLRDSIPGLLACK